MAEYLGSYAPSETVRWYKDTHAADGGRESWSAALDDDDFVVLKDGSVMTITAATIASEETFNSDAGIWEVTVNMANDADFTWGSRYWCYVHPDTETLDAQNIAGVLFFWDTFAVPLLTGTFSGTHSSTTSDLGTAAPSNDITGMTLFAPIDKLSVVVTSYNTGTGVATHTAWDTGTGVTDTEPWVLIPTAPIDATTLAAIKANLFDEIEDTINDAAATVTGFTVTTSVGSDVRTGTLRLTSGTLAGEARLVSWTGTTVAVLSHADMPSALKQFSAAPANGVTFTFTPLK